MSAQKNPVPFALFSPKGKKAKYGKLLKSAESADIILFGEIHNNAISHWLQHTLARDLSSKGKLSIGMEMFETDQQQALDKYLQGMITLEALDSVGQGLWSNYKTDYQPVVEFASEVGIPVIATNVPRPIARQVFRGGFASLDELSPEEKKLLPPLPIPYDKNLPGYVRMLEMMPGGHGGETFPMAQAIKDATMAHFIIANKKKGVPFLHLNGSYHSDDFEGIGWYLNKYAPDLKVMTISTVEQEQVEELLPEHKNKAHFIIAVPEMMTKTY
ncbi:ChaN family lipoprotein [Neolewinella agarilytica]|uniref:ChaN family lipoprotein n=1 Tax=Neolewinella agarilytica TaxID=478744 RepID=UPI002356571C|nr:ChaN family lipoprotein [Neolewinella agarilytica]